MARAMREFASGGGGHCKANENFFQPAGDSILARVRLARVRLVRVRLARVRLARVRAT